jgi:NAD(P)H-flavin reductase
MLLQSDEVYCFMSNPSKLQCNVRAICDMGSGTYRIDLEPHGRVPRFKSGQFLHLTVDDYDPEGGFWPESRAFSIASRSGQRVLTVVISVKGRYTSRIRSCLKVGLPVWVKLPYGDFTIESRTKEDADAVLVAGGTGISPFIPYLEELAERGVNNRRTKLFYGVRSLRQLLFKDLLLTCAKCGLVNLQVWTEKGPDESVALDDLCPVSGRLDACVVLSECAELKDPVYFLSGPPAMIDVFRFELSAAGVGSEHIQIDEWE